MADAAPVPRTEIGNLVRPVVWATLMLLLASAGMALVSPRSQGGSPLEDLMDVPDWPAARQVVHAGQHDDRTGALRATLSLDFVFLLAYAAFFYCTAAMLRERGAPSGVARLAIFATLLAAAVDSVENVAALRVLALMHSSPLPDSSAWIQLMRWSSVFKWLFAGIMCAATGWLWLSLWKRRTDAVPRRWAGAGAGACYAGAAVACWVLMF